MTDITITHNNIEISGYLSEKYGTIAIDLSDSTVLNYTYRSPIQLRSSNLPLYDTENLCAEGADDGGVEYPYCTKNDHFFLDLEVFVICSAKLAFKFISCRYTNVQELRGKGYSRRFLYCDCSVFLLKDAFVNSSLDFFFCPLRVLVVFLKII